MQTDPSALAHAPSFDLEHSDAGTQPSSMMPNLTDQDSRALEITYPNLSFEAADLIEECEDTTPKIPSTPRRHAPNIGKRRGYTPDLSRSAKSFSHSIKMAKIFQDASAGLQENTMTPSRHMSANTRRPRIPPSQHQDRIPLNLQSVGPGLLLIPQQIGTPSKARQEPMLRTIAAPPPPEIPYDQVFPTPMPYHDTPCGAMHVPCDDWEPPSSGFGKSVAITKEASNSGSDLSTRLRDFSLSPPEVDVDVDDGDCHSTHGVPLIISVPSPEPNKSNTFYIDAWLNDVLKISPESDASTAHEPQLPCSGAEDQEHLHPTLTMPEVSSPKGAITSPLDKSFRAPSQTSSNKENIHPTSSPLAAPPRIITPLPSSSSPRFRPSELRPTENPSHPKLPSTISSASRFQPLRTPGSLFAVAPTRRRQKQPTVPQEDSAIMTDKSTDVATKHISVALQVRNTRINSVFDIHEDTDKLSPAVTCFRKGLGPKRIKARCVSYYDTDILGENTSPTLGRGDSAGGKRKVGKDRRILGTHEESEGMCTPKAFTEEAEDARFDY